MISLKNGIPEILKKEMKMVYRYISLSLRLKIHRTSTFLINSNSMKLKSP